MSPSGKFSIRPRFSLFPSIGAFLIKKMAAENFRFSALDKVDLQK